MKKYLVLCALVPSLAAGTRGFSPDPDLGAGAEIYRRCCALCHGTNGEGAAGPNLADEYWLYGASFKDVFRSTKYGIPPKGMIPWKGTLNNKELRNVTAYVLSLAGTNPPGAKGPEGKKYDGQSAKGK